MKVKVRGAKGHTSVTKGIYLQVVCLRLKDNLVVIILIPQAVEKPGVKN